MLTLTIKHYAHLNEKTLFIPCSNRFAEGIRLAERMIDCFIAAIFITDLSLTQLWEGGKKRVIYRLSE